MPYVVIFGLLLISTGCSDFLSTGEDPPVQINFSEFMYFPDDTLGFTITNNTGEEIFINGCAPEITYNFEYFEEQAWIHHLTINPGPCPDEQLPWVALPPGERFIEEIHLDEDIFDPGFYRVVIHYRHEEDATYTEVPSDGVTITDGETI